ncbi:Alpha-amylase; AltName: Full=1,4-alpha-D-glucan glucanohydrolase; Flags: Precursor [Serendipita indica DSM 11827]|nr:Alpha-amylase; AltName: Full=1,4-alpha-D-glucan glucanohydrolase; Flags: Precursor [Serendipita indica DSM 11827]
MTTAPSTAISSALLTTLLFSVGASALPNLGLDAAIIAQMFEWNWNSIKAECVAFLGPAGYGYVQTSPPNAHIVGKQWWTAYQPTSYDLVSNRGTREEFIDMVNTCKTAGVQVIADAVVNHMSGASAGTSTLGTNFTHYDYPGTYSANDFHYCGLTPDNNIADYTNRDQVQKCQLVGLADLATDTDYVQGRLADYLKDLLSTGVTGLRIDAAKHIASSDITNILSRVGPVPYITQEVIYGDNEPIQPSEYVANGAVQEFRYTNTLKWAFTEGGIDTLQDFGNRGWLDSKSANVFVANHDTERDSSLNYKSAMNTYYLATIFSLAHPYGANPTVLSSYFFEARDDGAPNNWQGACQGISGDKGWLCQHRWPGISGLVGFRNTVGDSEITNWQTGTHQQIAFGRGNLGFVAINNESAQWSAEFTTSLPDGSYCNVNGGAPRDGCMGSPITISGGKFTANITPRTALAVHVGAMAPAGLAQSFAVNSVPEDPLALAMRNAGLTSLKTKRHANGIRSLKEAGKRRLSIV